jgi:hypothetical protein
MEATGFLRVPATPREKRLRIRNSPVKDVALNTSSHIVPIRRRKRPIVDGRASALDLFSPRGVDIRLRFRLEAFKKSNGDFGALLLGKAQYLIQQRHGINHAS